MRNNGNEPQKSWLPLLAALAAIMLLGVVFGMGGATPALAGPPQGTPAAPGGGPQATPGGPGGQGGGQGQGQGGQGAEQALANVYKRLQAMQDHNAKRLDVAGQIASHVPEWVASLKGKGCDTAALETAAAAFSQHIASAQAARDMVSGLIAAPLGFDSSGAVTDAKQARELIKQAVQSFRDAQKEFVSAAREFRQAANPARECGQAHSQGNEGGDNGGNGNAGGNGNGQPDDTETPEATAAP
jgi:hypothetical protein